MSKRNIEAVYALSPMQLGMLFHSLYGPESGVYFEQLSCTLRGELDVRAFQHAWQRVVDRHPILRTAFVWKNLERMLQVVHRRVELSWEEQDWRDLSAAEQETRREAFLRADRARGFDLSRAPLMRLALFRTADDAHTFVWSHHHILLDGWSLPLVLKEVLTFYEAFHQGQDLRLEQPRPYGDYIAWLQQGDLAQAEAFWRHELAGFTAPTPLVVDRPLQYEGKADVDHEGQTAELEALLPVQTTAALQSLARQQALTMSTVVQGAWALLLSRYSGEDDVVFGATVSGRPADLQGVETMVGVFINTLPARVQVPSDGTVVDWLKTLQARWVEMRQYEYSPLLQIQDWSGVPRGMPLFESILVFENYPVDAALQWGGEGIQGGGNGDCADAGSGWQHGSLKIEDVRSIEQTNYPLNVISGPGERLPLKISYNCRHFDAGTIRRMLGHLVMLLEGIAADPEGPITALPLLKETERQQLLGTWNGPEVKYPADRCAHELFEAQVAQHPQAVALLFEGERLTYEELNRRANQLAHHLQSRGVGPDRLVGIFAERSIEMVVGLLGVLKAGAAYLPLDPNYPRERLALMLQDAQISVLLTQQHLTGHLPSSMPHSPLSVLRLDADWPTIAQEADHNPISEARPDNLVYVIYTSGSTGKPKGVMVPHRALVNHALAMIDVFGLGSGDRLLQFLSVSFDASAEEFFPTLLSGATLVLPRPDIPPSGAALLEFCERQRVNILHLPASFWHQCVDELAAREMAVRAPLKILLVGGERPAIDRLRAWSRLVPRPIRFLNAYGPTETTITATFFETTCDQEAVSGLSQVPIGRPIPNVRVYVIDRQQRPVPVGVPGELCISGAGVARGYLDRPDLTAERFVPCPFSSEDEPGARMYRTGDLVRRLPDGNIEFLGRTDHQVKVRGFRVELEEIELALDGHPQVQQAVALAREDGGPGARRLVAYVVLGEDAGGKDTRDQEAGSGGTGPTVSELRGFLGERLPEYMVPSTYVVLESLPLLPNGKVNRRALPAPDWERPELESAYVAPRTPVEEVLVELWARVLGVERVGVHDDFFDLGGHSLLATRLISRAQEAFQAELPLRDLFDAPTVAGLAARIEAILREDAGLGSLSIEPVARDGALPLSFAQQRLWFLDQLAPENLFYNIPTAVRLEGQLNVAALEWSLNEVVRRHEVLRTTFSTSEGKPVQVIAPELRLSLPVKDLSHVRQEEREDEALRWAQEEARHSFDLAQGPLVRARLLKLGDEDHLAVLTMHHIVADGWSVEVLIRELATLYAAHLSTPYSLPPASLAPLPIQYADFAHWQRNWLQGEVLERQLSYWKDQLGDSPPMLDLPADRPRPAVQSWRGATESFTLPSGLSDQLKTLSREEGVTLFMTLLAAFQTLLYRYTGQDDVSVGTAVANRNRAQIEGLIGFFVNTLVMRTDLSGEPGFLDLLKRVRAVALGAYAHQDLPFEMLVEALQPQRDMSHTPLFQVAFALQNAPMETLALPGLALTPVELDTGTAKFDLTLTMAERPDGLGGAIEYNTDLFDAATIRRMVGHFQILLQGIVAHPRLPISRLPLLREAERQELLVAWNATHVPYPAAWADTTCAHELFEAQVAQRPDAVALTFEGCALSYAELDRQANQLAHYLQKLGVGPEVLVGISTDRSPEMIVGILGTLKAGGAYLPLDPTYPPERLAFMMQDAQISVLLTQQHLRGQDTGREDTRERDTREEGTGGGEGVPYVLLLDADWPTIAREPNTKPATGVRSDNLAYVIYTSGSTGKPKGAMLRHRGLCNLAAAQRQAFGIERGSRVLQFSPFSFDASVWETFMALANGATLCLARQEVLASGQGLVRLMRDVGVTNVTLPPSVLRVLPVEHLPELQTVIAAGEACTPELVACWAPGRCFFNAYGPTETTVCASMYLCDENDPDPPPIGRPIANADLYVLDRALQPVPAGVPGELHVGGVSLARGYLNRPGLTATKFVPHPFAAQAGSRLYKTGDLVRYRADGNIEFLGRIDHQVKVRGFRIELGEIETVLGRHPALRDSVVVAQGDGIRDSRLVAYVTAQDGAQPPNAGELRGFLREKLPEYMVPSLFVTMEQLPLSPSGKVDRRALPVPDPVRPDLDREYVPPRSDTEQELATICAELLGVDRVGVYDNFFELGGHSLLATQLISRLRDTFHVELPLRALFETPDVAGLAARVEAAGQAVQPDDGKIARMLDLVSQLSEDEVQAKLAAMLAEREGLP